MIYSEINTENDFILFTLQSKSESFFTEADRKATIQNFIDGKLTAKYVTGNYTAIELWQDCDFLGNNCVKTIFISTRKANIERKVSLMKTLWSINNKI